MGSDDERTLRIERVFDASQQAVYDAWTVPEQLLKWWGPEGMRAEASEAQIDVRVGGSYRTKMVSPSGLVHTVCGEYKTLRPHDLVVMTWAWEKDGARGNETEITVALEARGAQTLMRFQQYVFPSKDACEQHGEGWNSSFNKLDRVFTKGDKQDAR